VFDLYVGSVVRALDQALKPLPAQAAALGLAERLDPVDASVSTAQEMALALVLVAVRALDQALKPLPAQAAALGLAERLDPVDASVSTAQEMALALVLVAVRARARRRDPPCHALV
jgi:hypothetical protein